MNTNNTPNSTGEGPPATTSNAYGHAAADATAQSPTTVHAPSSTNTNYNNNNPAPAANAANQDAKVKPTSVESPPANENDCIEAQLDEETADVSKTLASLPQPILPKPPRPFNVADYDEGEDAKLKSAAKQSMAAASSLPQPEPNRRATNGLELTDDHGRPLPIGTIEAKLDEAELGGKPFAKPSGKLEQIKDDEGASSLEATNENEGKAGAFASLPQPILPKPPRPFNVADYDEGEDAKLKSAAKQSMADASDAAASSLPQPQPYRIEPPRPFNMADYDEGEDAKLKSEAKQVDASKHEDSIIVPTEENMADGAALDPVISRERRTRGDEGGAVDLELGGKVETLQSEEEESEELLQGDVAPFNGELPVLKAYIVEEESEQDVVIATHVEPTLPWWKQRRTKLLLGTVFVVFAVMAIALGVAFSSRTDSDTTNATVIVTVDSSNSPSVSAIPSTFPSPSPSSSPTSCKDIIVSGRQTIDLGLGDPQYLKVVVDGSNMVLTVRDGLDSSILHIKFYSLGNDVWVRTSQFGQDYDHYFTRVAISGKAAFVGLPYSGDNDEGMVLVYTQDEFGSWKEIEDPFTLDTEFSTVGFGLRADISGDLACVEDRDNTYLFHRDGDTKWIQFDMIANAHGCSIDGDTVAIQEYENYDDSIQLYTYINGGIVPLQDPIEFLDGIFVNLGQLNGNNLVIAKDVDDDNVNDHISIYHRDKVNGTFSFLQQLNISTRRYGYVSIDKDLMVAGADDGQSHIFSEQNGYWVETLVLDENHDSYMLSDRNLLAWGHRSPEIHYYNLDRCTQAWPTQTPSLSLMPSSPPTLAPSVSTSSSPSISPTASTSPTVSPSSSPSISPTTSSSPTVSPSSSPSVSPTASTSPTGSYCIIVTIVYDDYPTKTSWKLFSFGLDGTEVEVKSYSENDWYATSHTETACLTEGDYKFVIYDPFGLCCYHGEGHYNVTTLDGQLISMGARFENEEATRFSIPFAPAS